MKNETKSLGRENCNTTIDPNLWFYVKLIATNMSRPRNTVYANELIEIGLIKVISLYERYLPDEIQKEFREYIKEREGK